MPNYRRAFAPGGCWFFTVNLLDRRGRLLTDHIVALREATRLTQTRHPFSINAHKSRQLWKAACRRRNALWVIASGCYTSPKALSGCIQLNICIEYGNVLLVV
jgi:hypothetical protein